MTTPQKKYSRSIELIELIGSPVENFYQLGLQDKEGHNLLFEHMEKLLKLPGKRIRHAISRMGEIASSTFIALDDEYKSLLQSYCEGLGRDPENYLFTLMLPEFASNLGKWLPSIPLIGCSSYFGYNKQHSPVHLRILDFSLFPTYEDHERAVWYDFKGQNKVLSFSTAGMPFAGLHGISSAGFSVALHQKFTPVAKLQGATPIFAIVHHILLHCKNEREILRYLKSVKSITTWGINILFANGKVLEIDISGEQLYTRTQQLSPGQWHYINNRPIKHDPAVTFPLGMENYCDMRYCSAAKKIKKLHGKQPTNNTIFKQLTSSKLTPLKQKKWNLDTTTPSTLSAILFDLQAQEALYSTALGPKIFAGQMQEFKMGGNRICYKDKCLKFERDNLAPGYRRLLLAQKYFDYRQTTECYHEVQMAIELLKDHHEEYVARFFFVVFQYILDPQKYSRHFQRDTLLCLVSKLPPYLADHAKIFIHKIERELKLEITFKVDDIVTERLRKVFNFDAKIPFALMHRIFAYTIVPRADILEVIYTYLKI